MILKGIRGATSADENSRDEILSKTKELLLEMAEKNAFEKDNIASIFLTMTEDLDAEFPAVSARQIGWTDVPLLCAREIMVKDSLKKCIRVLIHYNTDKQFKAEHVYLHNAKTLRPDLNNKD
ncbi:MAG: chorismate mutase [Candidatus Margulisbacteria bacterium GWF2_35_9]|nr:MAG: chorismate mutase [Candidatus Margulisbacteria bacterium GWF2_35_9]